MSLWIRAASASSRIPRHPERSGGALEADEPADQRVVAGMGGVAVPLAEELVESVLGRGQGVGERQAEPSQPGRADRDEQRLDRLHAALEILDPLPDQVLPRKLPILLARCHARYTL